MEVSQWAVVLQSSNTGFQWWTSDTNIWHKLPKSPQWITIESEFYSTWPHAPSFCGTTSCSLLLSFLDPTTFSRTFYAFAHVSVMFKTYIPKACFFLKPSFRIACLLPHSLSLLWSSMIEDDLSWEASLTQGRTFTMAYQSVLGCVEYYLVPLKEFGWELYFLWPPDLGENLL